MPISTLSNNNYLHNTNPKRQNSPLSNLESLKVWKEAAIWFIFKFQTKWFHREYRKVWKMFTTKREKLYWE